MAGPFCAEIVQPDAANSDIAASICRRVIRSTDSSWITPLRRGLRLAHAHGRGWPQVVGAARGHFVAGVEIAEHFDERAGGDADLDVDPLDLAGANADDER